MAQAKFEINRDLYKELSLADAKLKSTIDFFEKKKMSSQQRLFFKIWASDKLKIGVFDKGITVLKKDEVPLSAYAITLGSVECSDKEHSYELGPGSVIGLAIRAEAGGLWPKVGTLPKPDNNAGCKILEILGTECVPDKGKSIAKKPEFARPRTNDLLRHSHHYSKKCAGYAKSQ